MSKLRSLVPLAGLAAFAVIAALGTPADADQAEVNVYSARHYQTDQALYDNFTRQTGIKLNLIEASDEQIVERLRSEGQNSPADVVLLVDAGRLWRADQLGLLRALRSPVLAERIPANLRHPEGQWYGFSTRARAIIYRKGAIDPASVARYEDLADPRLKGRVCMRSSGNIYNLSLLAALISHDGEAAAEAWAKGVVANFARAPQGGDTDQIRAVAAGECDVTLANTYYYARLMKSGKPEDKAVVEKTGVVWPNQDGRGAHINISGGGIARHAPHADAARRFLEYLSGSEAQGYFADGNNEYPVVSETLNNPALKTLGNFKADTLNVEAYGRHQAAAQMIYDRVGWK
jgi:iron(III) transport system substrate-binding protein